MPETPASVDRQIEASGETRLPSQFAGTQPSPWPSNSNLGRALSVQFAQSIQIPRTSGMIPREAVEAIQRSQRDWAGELAQSVAVAGGGMGGLASSERLAEIAGRLTLPVVNPELLTTLRPQTEALQEIIKGLRLPSIDPEVLKTLRPQTEAVQEIIKGLRLPSIDPEVLKTLSSQAEALHEIAASFSASALLEVPSEVLTEATFDRLARLAASASQTGTSPEGVATAVTESLLDEVRSSGDYDWSDPTVRAALSCATAGYVLLWFIYLYLMHPQLIDLVETLAWFVQIATASAIVVDRALSGGSVIHERREGGPEARH